MTLVLKMDDAISTLLNMALSNREFYISSVATFYFSLFLSSAFDCIQPHKLVQRLKTNHNHGLLCWLLDFLTEWSQHVKVNGDLPGASLGL